MHHNFTSAKMLDTARCAISWGDLSSPLISLHNQNTHARARPPKALATQTEAFHPPLPTPCPAAPITHSPPTSPGRENYPLSPQRKDHRFPVTPVVGIHHHDSHHHRCPIHSAVQKRELPPTLIRRTASLFPWIARAPPSRLPTNHGRAHAPPCRVCLPTFPYSGAGVQCLVPQRTVDAMALERKLFSRFVFTRVQYCGKRRRKGAC